jgi:hypothetical protein
MGQTVMKLSEMNNKFNAKKANKVMESRFGFAIDYGNLNFKKAYKLARSLSESLETIKRTHGIHTAERNPQYMELLMVRENLHRWMVDNKQQLITESEMGKSQAVLAAKDIVDTIQDMVEKVSKMQNEQVPALIDTIRDQISPDQAEAFKNAIRPTLDTLYQAMNSGRDAADNAARSLAGEQTAQPMGMGGAPGAPDLGPAPGADAGMDMGNDMDTDEFAATDAAAGGTAELGREKR